MPARIKAYIKQARELAGQRTAEAVESVRHTPLLDYAPESLKGVPIVNTMEHKR